MEQLERFNVRERQLETELDAERASSHSERIDGKGLKKIVKEMQEASGDDLVAIRSRLKMAIAAAVDEIRLYIYRGDRFTRLAYAHIKLADGSDRLFSVLKRRANPMETESDNLKWAGYQMPDKEVRRWLDVVAAEHLEEAIARLEKPRTKRKRELAARSKAT